jgi:AcrR family transcriptional regulator
MDSLVDELRISKSTLYKYFPSKEDLVGATIRNYTFTIDQKFEQLLADDSLSAIEKIIQFNRFYSQMVAIIGEEYLRDIELYYPDVWTDEVDFRTNRFINYFGKLYEIAVSKGIFRDDISSKVAILSYVKSTEMIYMKYLSYLGLSRQEAFDAIIDLLFRGVLTQEGIEQYQKQELSIGGSNEKKP